VLGEIAVRRMRVERDAGYSTTLDVPAVDLRHPRTGVLVRVAGETTPVSPPESMVSRMLRVPRGSILDRPPRD
jgi:tRNA(Ser,Leu) C12 N-acetylase TAN1